jgi:hypothetical protein
MILVRGTSDDCCKVLVEQPKNLSAQVLVYSIERNRKAKDPSGRPRAKDLKTET